MAKKLKRNNIKWKQVVASYVIAFILFSALTVLPNIKSINEINVTVQLITTAMLFGIYGFVRLLRRPRSNGKCAGKRGLCLAL